ncbi:FAD-dependent oxidoreductase [Reichenbachiella sp. MALMAid0571]|uniref:FAD-dependent oxidoreductase n=1 Tax=Reichenbachiella sp. MALMAid0571 TaxID=3143939 RepID=UPI0032E01DAD
MKYSTSLHTYMVSVFTGLFLSLSIFSIAHARQRMYDVVIYGGTSAGVVAAIQVKKMKKNVVLIEPSDRLGGLTTGGLGQTDIGNKQVVGGLSREFYTRVAKKYQDPKNWKWQKKEEYKSGGQSITKEGEESMWTFEPSMALEIFEDMIRENGVNVIYSERLDLNTEVKLNNGKIESIEMESGKTFSAKMFIDATYEGDLMALSGVSYTVGRESNDQYGESLNGVETALAEYHQFPDGVDPYIRTGEPSSGLLPNINPDIQRDGTADSKIQAYCYRMCLTDVPENRIPFKKPEGYNELEYELLFRAIEAGAKPPYFIPSDMPNRKTDWNNRGPFSTDYIGRNYNYAEGDYETRDKIREAHKTYQLGLMWTLAYHPRIPKVIREEISRWGLPKDEYEKYDNWTPQLYVREVRRMISDFVMTENHCNQKLPVEKSVGMGAYTMDSHNVQRYVTKEGYVKNEGNVEVGGFGPYPIAYQSIVPKKQECTNLFVPVCPSSTHMAFGSIRMEPVFMILGQSAATAASIAIDDKIAVQDINYKKLQKQLLIDRQILKN